VTREVEGWSYLNIGDSKFWGTDLPVGPTDRLNVQGVYGLIRDYLSPIGTQRRRRKRRKRRRNKERDTQKQL
jgi:hypothetical protein